jgi:hypothetical protein
MGHWYYLTTINKDFLQSLKTTVNEYPASIKRDTLDMMCQAHADEILARWVPVAVPEQQERVQREAPVYVTRYTGLPGVMVH